MTIWRMIAHHTNHAAVAWSRKHRRIAIGWGKIGDIANYNSVGEIKTAIKENYPAPDYPQNSGNGGPSLWDFANEIKIGDLVIVSGIKGANSLSKSSASMSSSRGIGRSMASITINGALN